jgi:uncharacterized membrane protein
MTRGRATLITALVLAAILAAGAIHGVLSLRPRGPTAAECEAALGEALRTGKSSRDFERCLARPPENAKAR